jgi:SulP family sulfate permease
VPSGFPQLSVQFISDFLSDNGFGIAKLLLPDAAFIALIAYVESVAIAKVTANLRGEKIIPNQELIALGAANIVAAVAGGMPVAGGFSRTMVNFAAGARTQMAMLIAAAILSLAVIFFTPWFTNIPKSVLAAIILLSIIRLVKIRHIAHTLRFDRGDGIAELATLLAVLFLGIEEGIILGIILTIGSHLRKASQPHIAVVGRVPDTEHFRNIKRHQVETWRHLLLVRIDESITFANIDYIEDYLGTELRRRPDTKHVVLIFNSVSDIDATALEALEQFNKGLQAQGRTLNIAEAKGPVMDKLGKTDFQQQLMPGKVFFRTEDAVNELGYMA